MNTYRVFATCDIGDEALQLLRERGYAVEVYDAVEPPPKALIIDKVRSGIDALITTLRDPIDADVLAAGADTLKLVAQDAVGFDNIDREAANRFGIPFTNTPGVLTDATAEFAVFIMGCLARKFYPAEQLVRQSRWTTWHPSKPFLGDELTGKTVAVIGTGRIGRAFARRCVGLGVDLLLYNRTPDEAFAEALDEVLEVQHRHGLASRRCRAEYVPFDEALRQADFVSLHVALCEDTRRLIDERALGLMKSTAYLINTARGEVVDETALAQALREERIAGAALDVFETEPLPDDSPLRDPALEDRVRLFPHFASAARATRLSTDPERGMAGRCVQNVIDVLEHEVDGDVPYPPCVVNAEIYDDSVRTAM